MSALYRCQNFTVCNNYIKHGKLCQKCQGEAQKLDDQVRGDEEKLNRLERKPRDWREAWGVRR